MAKRILKKTNILRQNVNIVRIVLVTALILMVPLVAMQFTDEVQWGPADFVIIGALLIGTGLIYELVVRKIDNATHRVILTVVLVAALLLIWAELAVGIFGTPVSGQ